MPLHVSNPQLFPDDVNPLPMAGSREQAALIDDELEIGNESYLERLRQLSDVTDNIYPELIRACRDTVAQSQPGGQPLRVLDLCSGIGVVTLQLAEAGVAMARVTLADFSAELLSRAQALLAKKLGDALPALDTVQLDLLVDDLGERAPGPYDLVVTCNAFQHFPRQRQAELFAQIHRVLAPGGVFVFESHFKPIRPGWKQHIVDSHQARLRSFGAPEPFVQQAAFHLNTFHNYVNLREPYEWFEAAGFSFYECVFRREEVGIFTSVK